MDEKEMRGLYKHPNIKALISTAHGEGFGLPLFEAAYSGLPVITHGWSGQADFLYVDRKPMFAACEYNILPVGDNAVWEGVITKDSQWAHIDSSSFRKQMRNVFSSYDEHEAIAKTLKKHVLKEFKPEKMYKQFADAVLKHFKLDQDEVDEWLNEMVFTGEEE